ncbi:MAG: BLUF domain-containing protein [Pedobacter sp.]|nr:MAG: BLUF domain-containing protein [Pedobacter sp.]
MLYLIMYVSVVSEDTFKKELQDILSVSRSWNKSHRITGILAYIEGKLSHITYCRFIQVIEGPEEEIKAIFEKIKNDKRHSQISVLKEGPTSFRNFATWEMGFEKIDLDKYGELQEFFSLDTKLLADQGNINENIVLNFMKAFYRNED